mmetsp:Transcript_4129/g.17512  ORF Transcript_4129/g.17512 Transcript_4129/m.17512 type:complete len:273 (-) Transcript_4129:53-871(-)
MPFSVHDSRRRRNRLWKNKNSTFRPRPRPRRCPPRPPPLPPRLSHRGRTPPRASPRAPRGSSWRLRRRRTAVSPRSRRRSSARRDPSRRPSPSRARVCRRRRASSARAPPRVSAWTGASRPKPSPGRLLGSTLRFAKIQTRLFSARTCREALRRVPPLSSYCDGLQLRPLTWGSRSRTWEYRRCSRSRRASPCAAAYLPPTLTRAFALPQRLASVCASDRSVKTCCIALASRVSVRFSSRSMLPGKPEGRVSAVALLAGEVAPTRHERAVGA